MRHHPKPAQGDFKKDIWFCSWDNHGDQIEGNLRSKVRVDANFMSTGSTGQHVVCSHLEEEQIEALVLPGHTGHCVPKDPYIYIYIQIYIYIIYSKQASPKKGRVWICIADKAREDVKISGHKDHLKHDLHQESPAKLWNILPICSKYFSSISWLPNKTDLSLSWEACHSSWKAALVFSWCFDTPDEPDANCLMIKCAKGLEDRMAAKPKPMPPIIWCQ